MGNLKRYIDIQTNGYLIALNEIKKGQKVSHWMWYIFPQIHSLGSSDIAKYYAFENIKECIDYLNNDYLFQNIYNICSELLKHKNSNPFIVFGIVDASKFQSSMTIFNYVYEKKRDLLLRNEPNIFIEVLNKFFAGQKDMKTITILKDDIDYD